DDIHGAPIWVRRNSLGGRHMAKLVQMLGNIKMTATIMALVMVAIIGSIIAVSGSIYFSLRAQSLANSELEQSANLGIAATILERRISGSVLNWSEVGTIASFQSWAIPPFYNDETINAVTRVTRQDATIYELKPETQVLFSKTSSLRDAKGRSEERRVGKECRCAGHA